MAKPGTQTAQIPFDSKRKRRRARNRSHPCRSLAVEHVAYNIEGGHCATCRFIRLKGRWLELTVGSRVLVTVRRRCIIIRPLQGTRHTVDNSGGREPK